MVRHPDKLYLYRNCPVKNISPTFQYSVPLPIIKLSLLTDNHQVRSDDHVRGGWKVVRINHVPGILCGHIIQTIGWQVILHHNKCGIHFCYRNRKWVCESRNHQKGTQTVFTTTKRWENYIRRKLGTEWNPRVPLPIYRTSILPIAAPLPSRLIFGAKRRNREKVPLCGWRIYRAF